MLRVGRNEPKFVSALSFCCTNVLRPISPVNGGHQSRATDRRRQATDPGHGRLRQCVFGTPPPTHLFLFTMSKSAKFRNAIPKSRKKTQGRTGEPHRSAGLPREACLYSPPRYSSKHFVVGPTREICQPRRPHLNQTNISAGTGEINPTGGPVRLLAASINSFNFKVLRHHPAVVCRLRQVPTTRHFGAIAGFSARAPRGEPPPGRRRRPREPVWPAPPTWPAGSGLALGSDLIDGPDLAGKTRLAPAPGGPSNNWGCAHPRLPFGFRFRGMMIGRPTWFPAARTF